ncbi:AMP-binding protein [Ectopseudomonas khazarica]|uniref:AMP-binding protein n=1 Tax=Ectopseudomonas khazarica TaxID=2502979 RepID=UPI00106EF502|nr:AMP-binding protein [Pseudomonas khazarica]
MNHPNKKENSRLRVVSTQDNNELHEPALDTLDELLRRGAVRAPEAAALSALGVDVSYADLQAMSASIAAWLTRQGLEPGACVAVVLPNLLAHPIACLGIIRAGLTAVCVNPLYTGQELVHIFQDSDVKAVFFFDPMSGPMQHAVQAAGIAISVRVTPGDMLGWRRPLVNWIAKRRLRGQSAAVENAVSWRRVTSTRPVASEQMARPEARQIAFIIYSGGTTGQPKGVPISHRALLHNVAQQYSALRQHLSGRAEHEYVLLLAVPLYHILGLGNLLFSLARGGKAVPVMNPRDTAALAREWARHRISSFPGVNTLYSALLEHGEFRALDFSSLVICLGAGMPVSEATAKHWHQVTGCHITEAYGMTETGLISCNPAGRSRPGSVGLPVSGIEISLRDESDSEVTIGEGEICVRSPAIMSGYWKREADNASAFTSDGFFRTGDVGTFDADGYLRIIDRKKEMIICSGFKVFPSEVERVLNAHPGIRESAVIPTPDDKAGEVPVAYIVRRQPYLEEQHVMKHCEKHLVSYKRPRRIIFCDELPKSAVGKVLRKALIESHARERNQ